MFENKVMAVYLAEPVSDTIAVIVTISMFIVQFRKSLKEIETEKPEKSKKNINTKKPNKVYLLNII